MELAIQLVALATAVVGLATAMVKAVSVARGERPETKGGHRN
ncbi:hypothetical protein [uncultured Adlercreutzia sp.]|nr:hypothetical protein [uncultured Adlercreutzia sp.]